MQIVKYFNKIKVAHSIKYKYVHANKNSKQKLQ